MCHTRWHPSGAPAHLPGRTVRRFVPHAQPPLRLDASRYRSPHSPGLPADWLLCGSVEMHEGNDPEGSTSPMHRPERIRLPGHGQAPTHSALHLSSSSAAIRPRCCLAAETPLAAGANRGALTNPAGLSWHDRSAPLCEACLGSSAVSRFSTRAHGARLAAQQPANIPHKTQLVKRDSRFFGGIPRYRAPFEDSDARPGGMAQTA